MAGYYLATLTRLLSDPRRFFDGLGPDMSPRGPLIFLTVSALVSAGAGVATGGRPASVILVSILFINGMGMALLAAGFGYLSMVTILGRRAPFSGLVAVHALASGATLLAAWIPFFLFLTEPWKWWLVGVGLTRALGFSTWQALLNIVLTIVVLVLFFLSVLPLTGRPGL